MASRREFLRGAAAAAAAAAAVIVVKDGARAADVGASPAAAPVEPTAAKVPDWRGFNLLEKFTARSNRPNGPYQEKDFEIMADWGFNYVRLPTSYLCWTKRERPREYDESQLKHIDQAVEWGRQYKIHVDLNLHRAPGYCVNPPEEPLSLWKDAEALELCAAQWAHFAKRYKGIPSAQLSFNLLNEPKDIPGEVYFKVAKALVDAIRAEDPHRLIVADGLKWASEPAKELIPLGVVQSTRGYRPSEVSHYRASWVQGSDQWPVPTWPLRKKRRDGSEEVIDKAWLRRWAIGPWKELEGKGVGVHVGEWGAHNQTPHEVVLAWAKDQLELWKEAKWGWALWNLRGSFGVFDSNRKDVTYENFKGHRIDRKFAELLRAY